jgi:prophage regulatory protein
MPKYPATATAPILELPSTGFLRVHSIVGHPKRGIPALLPICKTSWWEGVKSGKYPKGFLLGPRTRVWAVEDIKKLIEAHKAAQGVR